VILTGKWVEKVKLTLELSMKAQIGSRSTALPSLTSALDRGGWLTSRSGRFTPGNDPVHTVQEAGLASGIVLTGTKNPATTGIQSADRPARSESLYRLRHIGPR
jgi:hypothetical protein